MGLFGKKKTSGKVTVENLAGIVVSEHQLMEMLQSQFPHKLKHITMERDSFVIHFDRREVVNSMIMGREDMVNFFQKYFGRPVIQVTTFEGGHEQYLVRFEE